MISSGRWGTTWSAKSATTRCHCPAAWPKARRIVSSRSSRMARGSWGITDKPSLRPGEDSRIADDVSFGRARHRDQEYDHVPGVSDARSQEERQRGGKEVEADRHSPQCSHRSDQQQRIADDGKDGIPEPVAASGVVVLTEPQHLPHLVDEAGDADDPGNP